MASRPVGDFDRAASEYIRHVATSQRIAQDTLSEQSGISYGSFRRYWTGERHMSLGDFDKIMHVLGVPTDWAMADVVKLVKTGLLP